jgi:hypothetical protein
VYSAGLAPHNDLKAHIDLTSLVVFRKSLDPTLFNSRLLSETKLSANFLHPNPITLQNWLRPWSSLSRFFDDIPLSFRPLARLTINDNLIKSNQLSYSANSTYLWSSLVDDNTSAVTSRTPQHKFSFRRIKTLWVSKVTQCALTPARNHFLKYHSLKFLYQKKITKFIFTFYSLSLKNSLTSLSSTFKVIFFYSGLATSTSQFNWFFQNNFIFLNFQPLFFFADISKLNLNFGDVISLLITPRLILFNSFWELGLLSMRRRFFKFLRYFRIRSSRKPPKQPSFRIPDWVDRIYFYHDSTSYFIETDLLTQTAYYLNISSIPAFRLLSQRQRYTLPFLTTLRSLNWKSLT